VTNPLLLILQEFLKHPLILLLNNKGLGLSLTLTYPGAWFFFFSLENFLWNWSCMWVVPIIWCVDGRSSRQRRLGLQKVSRCACKWQNAVFQKRVKSNSIFGIILRARPSNINPTTLTLGGLSRTQFDENFLNVPTCRCIP